MHHHAAFQVQSVAVTLRASHPLASALDVLDQAMSGYRAADLPTCQWAADRTMPASPFGQLLLAAFGRRMTPEEWRAYTSDAADPELAAAVINIWPTVVIAGLTERYRDLHADGGLRPAAPLVHPQARPGARNITTTDYGRKQQSGALFVRA